MSPPKQNGGNTFAFMEGRRGLGDSAIVEILDGLPGDIVDGAGVGKTLSSGAGVVETLGGGACYSAVADEADVDQWLAEGFPPITDGLGVGVHTFAPVLASTSAGNGPSDRCSAPARPLALQLRARVQDPPCSLYPQSIRGLGPLEAMRGPFRCLALASFRQSAEWTPTRGPYHGRDRAWTTPPPFPQYARIPGRSGVAGS
ncbi:hypothetical protein PF008_g22468 [Phytophthora fragariae]|uniref:Uncharacterized protein n=1 Tax=Phytophthora fragariae TaxID=53985 RepID=A0A6G0QTM3_9STRA|nr:hypothetical protein PF008_g22468 [Phytophthora fragariae]